MQVGFDVIVFPDYTAVEMTLVIIKSKSVQLLDRRNLEIQQEKACTYFTNGL